MSPRVASDPWRMLRDYRGRSEHRLVGLMTGTSADAVDAVLVRFRGFDLETEHQVEAHLESPFEPELRREILHVASSGSLPLERLIRLDQALGERYAAAVLELLAGAGASPAQVDAIGLHGQTVRHVPRDEGGGQALTLQIGSAAVLAERTGVAVVSDFRSRDTAAGGEGAPLVPRVDWWLFHSERESRVLLNLGGMANVTWLGTSATVDEVVGFDTGPGNAVIDALVAMIAHGESFDEGGRRAAAGTVSETLLEELMSDPFFAQPPPRSTGRERFGASYAAALRARGLALGLSDEDLLATAVALTAESVARAVRDFLTPLGVDVVYASGGGVRNGTLLRALAERLAPVRVATIDALGTDAQGKEALAFAFLAHQTLCGAPGNAPRATGASHPVVLGHVTPGA